MEENHVNNEEILIPEISESEFLLTDVVTNKFTAKYKLIALGDSVTSLEITASRNEASDILTEVNAKVNGVSQKEIELDIKHRGNSYVFTEIQPMGFIDYLTEIEVRPHNRMWAIYETQRPPIVTSILKPTQDSFTREKSEYSSINYGSSSSMVVGRDNADIWRSYIQFDFNSINPSFILTESKLRLYYKGSSPKNLRLELLNADTAWSEYSVTHLNKPNPVKLISNVFTENSEKGYIEFDVMDIVKSWLSKAQDNNGFIVRLANESSNGQTTFYTRETSFAPELNIKYYDSTVFSQGRTQVPTEINIMKFSGNDVNTELEVKSTYNFSYATTELYVHRTEVPLDNEILTEITATNVLNKIELIVSKRDESEYKSEITIRIPEINSKDTEISVTRDVVESELYVKNRLYIPTEITVKASENSTTLIEITANREVVPVELFVKYANIQETEIDVRGYNYSETNTEITSSRPVILTEIRAVSRGEETVITEITASKPLLLTEITVTQKNTSAELSVRVAKYQDLYASVSVSRQKVDTELTVKYRSDIPTEITPNIKSDVYTEIVVINTIVGTEITPRLIDNSELESEIFVKYEFDIPTELEFKVTNQVLTEIFARSVSQVPTEILHSKDSVVTTITIPTWVDLDMVTEIQPRIFMVNNVVTRIQVGSYGGAYAFII